MQAEKQIEEKLDPATQTSAQYAAEISPAREERLFLLLSIFIGVIAGLLVVSFRMAIDWLQVLLLGASPAPHQIRLLIAPAAAGLVIALLTKYVFPQVRGSGVNQTKAALYISNGYISIRTVIGKFLLSSLAIGSGHSLGPEDPSLQIGAGVASLISRRMGLSREKLRIFAPVGAAAGLAAAFNAPISAILFVIEEVIGQWSAGVLGSIVLSAVASVVVARSFWGSEPMFRIPVVTELDSRELLAYAVLGLVGGVASLVFAKSLGYLRPRLRTQTSWTLLQPAVAGLLVGGIGYFGLPQVMGAGYEAIDQAMHAQFGFKILILLAIFKIVATTLSFSSGTPGGMFAPTLFIGAMLGAAVGTAEKHYFGHLTGSTGSYALVGMGVLFAAFLRAPLTSVFMVLEVSGNYSVILPVILANTIAYLISRSLQPVPIFELFTHQDGLFLPSMEEQREEKHDLHFEDALGPIGVPVFNGSEGLLDARKSITEVFEKGRYRGRSHSMPRRQLVCGDTRGARNDLCRHHQRPGSEADARSCAPARPHPSHVPGPAFGQRTPLFQTLAAAAYLQPCHARSARGRSLAGGRTAAISGQLVFPEYNYRLNFSVLFVSEAAASR